MSHKERGPARPGAWRQRALGALIPLCALAVLAAACGGGSAGSSSSGENSTGAGNGADVATAQAALSELEAPVSFTAPGPPVNPGSSLNGKVVYVVVNGISAPFVQSFIAGVEEAAALVGMTVTAVDGAGSTGTAASLIERGVSQGAAAIVVQAFPAEALSAAIQKAKDASIPVIEVAGRDPGLPDEAMRELGVQALATFCYSCTGTQLAQAVVAESGGGAQIAMIDMPDVPVSGLMADAFKEEIERLCSDCKIREYHTSVARFTTEPASITSSILTSTPGEVYLVPLFDSMVTVIQPSIASLNAEDRVKIVTQNATLPPMQLLQEGRLVVADIGQSSGWLGWATVDQIIRLLTGGQPAADEKIPNRAFTAANIDSIDLDAPESTWFGADYKAEYTSLWGR